MRAVGGYGFHWERANLVERHRVVSPSLANESVNSLYSASGGLRTTSETRTI